MQRTATLPVPSVDGGLAKYLAEIRKFPILRPEREMAYARRWREHGDREAAYHLVTSHLRLVAKIAMRYRGYGLPIADIISEGNLGLMHAVKRFEPQRGFRLATYAMCQGHHTGVHPALLVAGENRRQFSSKETVLQAAPYQSGNLRT
jgi:RNA polymerase sigma-32 factor